MPNYNQIGRHVHSRITRAAASTCPPINGSGWQAPRRRSAPASAGLRHCAGHLDRRWPVAKQTTTTTRSASPTPPGQPHRPNGFHAVETRLRFTASMAPPNLPQFTCSNGVLAHTGTPSQQGHRRPAGRFMPGNTYVGGKCWLREISRSTPKPGAGSRPTNGCVFQKSGNWPTTPGLGPFLERWRQPQPCSRPC